MQILNIVLTFTSVISLIINILAIKHEKILKGEINTINGGDEKEYKLMQEKHGRAIKYKKTYRYHIISFLHSLL